MKKLWSVILTVVIVLAVLGCVVFALGLLMDADLVRDSGRGVFELRSGEDTDRRGGELRRRAEVSAGMSVWRRGF